MAEERRVPELRLPEAGKVREHFPVDVIGAEGIAQVAHEVRKIEACERLGLGLGRGLDGALQDRERLFHAFLADEIGREVLQEPGQAVALGGKSFHRPVEVLGFLELVLPLVAIRQGRQAFEAHQGIVAVGGLEALLGSEAVGRAARDRRQELRLEVLRAQPRRREALPDRRLLAPQEGFAAPSELDGILARLGEDVERLAGGLGQREAEAAGPGNRGVDHGRRRLRVDRRALAALDEGVVSLRREMARAETIVESEAVAVDEELAHLVAAVLVDAAHDDEGVARLLPIRIDESVLQGQTLEGHMLAAVPFPGFLEALGFLLLDLFLAALLG